MPLSRLKPKSDSAVVRNMLAEIETALSAGASRESIWKTLCAEQGLSITFDGFCKALWRARKSKGERANPKPLGPPAPTSVPPSAAPEKPGTDVDCAIQKDGSSSEQQSSNDARKNRIRTSKDFDAIHKMDFNELDPKFK